MTDTAIIYRCELCWQTFDTDAELLAHQAVEDDRLYDLDGDE